MDIYKEIQELERKGVFIDFISEYYGNGTNCNFSITFIDPKTNKLINKTGLYGDNHEFGDTADVLVAAIKLAKWLSVDNRVTKYFEDVTETITPEGHARWMRTCDFRKTFGEFLHELCTTEHQLFCKEIEKKSN